MFNIKFLPKEIFSKEKEGNTKDSRNQWYKIERIQTIEKTKKIKSFFEKNIIDILLAR